jgi:transcriptional regulator GlxA family with amidase domain
MESHIADPLDLTQMSKLVGLSTRQLQRQFTETLGQSVIQKYLALRLETAQGLLKNSRMTIAEISQMTDFSSAAAFAEAYRKKWASNQAPLGRHLTDLPRGPTS